MKRVNELFMIVLPTLLSNIMVNGWFLGVLWMLHSAEANEFCKCAVNVTKTCRCTGDFAFIPPIISTEVDNFSVFGLVVQETSRMSNFMNGGVKMLNVVMNEVRESHSNLHFIQKSASTDELRNFLSERKPLDCWPQLDSLNPCEDLFTWTWLKGSVWVVLLIALIGNVLVLLIVTLSRSEKTVARFLMGNLAFADLCMAIYLLILASMDAISSNTYHSYAYLWQQGIGCKIAGFLTIFSCQLSFFTLSLLTVERWFSIKRALYSNLLDTRMTTVLMVFGWFYAVLMAALPLLGISSYSSTSICLPMDIHDYPSQLYILVLLCTGGIALLLMCFCYTQIYLSLRQETRHPRGGRSIALKIVVLVGTNFFCWTPIAFFALAAIAGHPLITMTHSKILLIFIYPINSCANPYLYVIMTKQFKKDFILLLARCGMCSHSAEQYRMNYSKPMSHETYQTTVNSSKGFVV